MIDRGTRFFLSVFGFGYLPLMPGTFGTLVGLTFCLVWALYWWVLPILFVCAYYLLDRCNLPDDSSNVDPQWVVIDEMIGMGVACTIYFNYYTFYHWLGLVLLFLWFRFFDIIKPFPINWIEQTSRRWNIPLSILLDDVSAGVLAALATIFVMPPIIPICCN